MTHPKRPRFKPAPGERRLRRPPPPVPAGAASRLAAADVLHLTLDGGMDLDGALESSAVFKQLEGSDRAFARAIAGAALRGLGRIDYALGGLVDRPLDQIEPPVRALLRVGCAQLWMLGVADHAAVSTTVDAARLWREARRGGGLINAVLRRASRENAAFDTAPATSVWPDWLSAKLKAGLGAEAADRMARLQLDEPPTDLTLKPGEDAQAWADRLGGEELASGSVRLPAGVRLAELPGYAEGQWWVQDAAASLAARLVGDVAGKEVADLCAAPGGKAMQLAAAGARLTAVEISRQRMERLRENVARLKLEMTIVEADARDWRPDAPLDAILLDAPCSALGVMRRHPEGAWRRDPKDLERFPKIQRALVDAAWEMLKPGGRLVYCVCTPSPEEGREVVDAAVASGRWRRQVLTPMDVPGFVHALTDDGDAMTVPAKRDSESAAVSENVTEPVESDVFYIARLERTGA